jgi:hypothetical protein
MLPTRAEFESLLLALLVRQMSYESVKTFASSRGYAYKARERAWDEVLSIFDTLVSEIAIKDKYIKELEVSINNR